MAIRVPKPTRFGSGRDAARPEGRAAAIQVPNLEHIQRTHLRT